MRTPAFIAVLLASVAAAVIVTEAQQRPPFAQERQVEPLLGVGNNPQPAPGTDPSADKSAPLFDDTVLHEIRLIMNSTDWQTLKTNYLSNTYYPTDFKWRDQSLRNVGIRSRGTGSRSGVKPGLRVDFDRYTSNQKLLGLKSIILRNNIQDESAMHERLSMALFRRLGAPASREAHVKLYVNDKYYGVYTIVESVDKDFLKRVYGEDGGFLYEYDFDNSAPASFEFDDRGSDGREYVPSPFKPATREADPQSGVVAQWVQTINNASDAAFPTAIAEFLDVKKFLRHVAIEVFLADRDGFLGTWGMNNFLVYRPDGSKQFNFIAWDKSEAFKEGSGLSIFRSPRDNRLFKRLLAVPQFYSLYLDMLTEAAQSAEKREAGASRGWLAEEVERVYTQIREAVLADGQKSYSDEAFENAVDALRSFARDRSGNVLGQVNANRR